MKEKFIERLPKEQGTGRLESYPAVKTPWGKMYDWHFAIQYASREGAVIGVAMMNALRMLIPDYETRAKFMCDTLYNLHKDAPEGEFIIGLTNIHPFMRGCFPGALMGDFADEGLLMTGRVNDVGTYRVEKELDNCPWDIIGSEVCRCTTACLDAQFNAVGLNLRSGPKMEVNMVEAKGCGDLHCRVVAECREKYPMPEKASWEKFGPIATNDMVKFTSEEDSCEEASMFLKDADYHYVTTNNNAFGWERAEFVHDSSAAQHFIHPVLMEGIKSGLFTEEQLAHALKCMGEVAGKASFGAFYAKEGLRSFLGVPREMGDEDTRILGDFIEMFLQCRFIPYEVEKFEAEESVYVIGREQFTVSTFLDTLIAYWYGASKTLLSAKFSLWEENSPEGTVRLKIARKIDKFC